MTEVAERVGFEPTCRFYPTIRFRVGAVMTASVPLRWSASFLRGGYSSGKPCGEGSFVRAFTRRRCAQPAGRDSPPAAKLAPSALDADPRARRAARGHAQPADLLLPRRAGDRGAGVRAGERLCGAAAREAHACTRSPTSAPCRRSSPPGAPTSPRPRSPTPPSGAASATRPRPYARIPQLVVYQRSGVRPRDTLQLEVGEARGARRQSAGAHPAASEEHRRPGAAVGGDRAELGRPGGGRRLPAKRSTPSPTRANSPSPITCTRTCWWASRCPRSGRCNGSCAAARPICWRASTPSSATSSASGRLAQLRAGLLRRYAALRLRGIARVSDARRRPPAALSFVVRAGGGAVGVSTGACSRRSATRSRNGTRTRSPATARSG